VPGSDVVLNQDGYSATTSYVATNNNYLTPAHTLSNPFPEGFTPATGSSLGASTNLGQDITFYAPVQKDPYALRWNLGMQYSLTPNTLLEVDYIGDHAVHEPIANTSLNYIPQRFLSTLPTRDPNVINSLTAVVPNPFAGLLPGTGLNGATTTASQLLMTYPQFNSVTEQNVTEGSSVYHSLAFRVEKRMSHGLSLTGNYGFSKLIESMQYLNPGDAKLARIVSPYDHKHHMAVGSTYELPIGTGKLIDIQSGFWNSIIGGFKVNGVYLFQTGAPVYFSSDLPLASGASLASIRSNPRSINSPALTTSAFNTHSSTTNDPSNPTSYDGQFQYHLRTLPFTFDRVRTDGINQFDSSLLKDFRFPKGMYAQFRFEVFNALNHASFASPAVSSATSSSFGTITSQANSARTVQFGGRFVF